MDGQRGQRDRFGSPSQPVEPRAELLIEDGPAWPAAGRRSPLRRHESAWHGRRRCGSAAGSGSVLVGQDVPAVDLFLVDPAVAVEGSRAWVGIMGRRVEALKSRRTLDSDGLALADEAVSEHVERPESATPVTIRRADGPLRK